MIEREVIGVEQINVTSEHVLYSSEEANKLVLFFPGGNSNTSGPYFYYLRDYFLRNGYDVLCLSYIGLVKQGDSYDDQVNKISEGIQAANLYVQKTKTYTETVYVSRSFGNVLSNVIRIKFDLDVDTCIYISPVAQALPDIKKFPGFIITSDNDEYIEEKHLKEIQLYPDHEVLIIEGADHSLECEDTLKNIDFCKNAIAKAITFIVNSQK